MCEFRWSYRVTRKYEEQLSRALHTQVRCYVGCGGHVRPHRRGGPWPEIHGEQPGTCLGLERVVSRYFGTEVSNLPTT